MIKDAQPPAPQNGAVARYRHARRIHDLLVERWARTQFRRGEPPTFEQVNAVLFADEVARIQDGEPMRWGLS